MLSACLREGGPAPAAAESAGTGAGVCCSEAVPPAPARLAAAEGPETLNFEAFSLLEEKWHGRPSRGGAVRGMCSIQ